MVVRDRLGRGRRRARVRHPGHVLSQPAADRGRQSERVRPAPASLCARGARHSSREPASPRPARGARRIRPRERERGHDPRRHRRLVALPRRRRLSGARRCPLVHARSRLRGDAADAAQWRRRLFPEGAACVAVELLLQPSAARGHRNAHDRWQRRSGNGTRVARSRMVERGDGTRSRRMGLDRHRLRRTAVR